MCASLLLFYRKNKQRANTQDVKVSKVSLMKFECVIYEVRFDLGWAPTTSKLKLVSWNLNLI